MPMPNTSSDCILCQMPEPAETVYESARDYLTGEAFAVRRCGRCGLVWTELGEARASLHRYYGPAYYGAEWGKLRPVIERFLRWRSRRWAGAVCRRWQVRSVVDVGCGRGDLLRAFHGYGATAIGLEAADAPHWMLTGAVDGIRIHPTTETGPWPVPDASADLVIFRHTLEHFPDPITALREARRVIRDQGRLVIVVPNWSSRQRRVAGPQWLHLDVPRHCYHFDEGSLRAILNRTEFSPEASWCGEFHQDLYGWPQSVANRLLPGTPNALYRLLQGGPAWETCPSHTAAAMQAVVAALTAPAWLLLYLLAAAERSQAVVTAVARPAGAVPGNAGR